MIRASFNEEQNPAYSLLFYIRLYVDTKKGVTMVTAFFSFNL